MSIAGQVWRFVSPLSSNNFYIVEDRGRVFILDRYEYSYLLYCINSGRKIDYCIGEPIQENGMWRRIA